MVLGRWNRQWIWVTNGLKSVVKRWSRGRCLTSWNPKTRKPRRLSPLSDLCQLPPAEPLPEPLQSEISNLKRAPSPATEEPEPKRQKIESLASTDVVAAKKAKRKVTKQPRKTKVVQDEVDLDLYRTVVDDAVAPPPVILDVPTAVAEVRVSPSSGVGSPAPVESSPTEEQMLPPQPRVDPLPESVVNSLLKTTRICTSSSWRCPMTWTRSSLSVNWKLFLRILTLPASFRKHITGSARTEGYYKISHAERLHMSSNMPCAIRRLGTRPGKRTVQQPIMSSRSNRANARRRAQGTGGDKSSPTRCRPFQRGDRSYGDFQV